jgi:hypothetical protein
VTVENCRGHLPASSFCNCRTATNFGNGRLLKEQCVFRPCVPFPGLFALSRDLVYEVPLVLRKLETDVFVESTLGPPVHQHFFTTSLLGHPPECDLNLSLKPAEKESRHINRPPLGSRPHSYALAFGTNQKHASDKTGREVFLPMGF